MNRNKTEEIFALARQLRESDEQQNPSNHIFSRRPDSYYIDLATRLVEHSNQELDNPQADPASLYPKTKEEARGKLMREIFGNEGPPAHMLIEIQLRNFLAAAKLKDPTFHCSRATFLKTRKSVYGR